jgi:hypothetical protein
LKKKHVKDFAMLARERLFILCRLLQ